MAVNNKQPICPNKGRLCMCIKVLKLREREVVVDLASRRDSNNLIAR
jgi:hypothetical protein